MIARLPTARILRSTVVAGTIDVLATALPTLAHGRSIGGILRCIASGRVPAACRQGRIGAR